MTNFNINSNHIGAGDHADVLSTINLIEQTFDEGNFDTHQQLLMRDFSFSSPFGNFSNVEDYMTWLKSFYQNVLAQGGTRHLITNPIVKITNDEALCFSYLVILNRKSMTFMGTSVLQDRLQRVNGVWRCKTRVIESDQFSPEQN